MFDEVNIGMRIIQIENDEEKKHITRNILEALPDWFGISEAREEYIHDSMKNVFFCALENEKKVVKEDKRI